MHTFVYMCVYLYTCVYIGIHLYVYMCVYMHAIRLPSQTTESRFLRRVSVLVCTYAYICIYVSTYAYICMCVHMHSFVHICVHMHTFVYMCVHVYILYTPAYFPTHVFHDHILIHGYVHIYSHRATNMCVHMHTFVYMCVHVYVVYTPAYFPMHVFHDHIYTDTCICSYILTQGKKELNLKGLQNILRKASTYKVTLEKSDLLEEKNDIGSKSMNLYTR
jgi:hypothetical protein